MRFQCFTQVTTTSTHYDPEFFNSTIHIPLSSTVSAYLNCVSGLLYKDYICRYVPDFQHTERKANLIMKLIICLLGVYCIGMGVLVERSTSLFQVQITMSSLINGAVVGVFTLALFYPWASQKVDYEFHHSTFDHRLLIEPVRQRCVAHLPALL